MSDVHRKPSTIKVSSENPVDTQPPNLRESIGRSRDHSNDFALTEEKIKNAIKKEEEETLLQRKKRIESSLNEEFTFSSSESILREDIASACAFYALASSSLGTYVKFFEMLVTENYEYVKTIDKNLAKERASFLFKEICERESERIIEQESELAFLMTVFDNCFPPESFFKIEYINALGSHYWISCFWDKLLYNRQS